MGHSMAGGGGVVGRCVEVVGKGWYGVWCGGAGRGGRFAVRTCMPWWNVNPNRAGAVNAAVW